MQIVAPKTLPKNKQMNLFCLPWEAKKQTKQIRSFVFWENLRCANLLSVLSDLSHYYLLPSWAAKWHFWFSSLCISYKQQNITYLLQFTTHLTCFSAGAIFSQVTYYSLTQLTYCLSHEIDHRNNFVLTICLSTVHIFAIAFRLLQKQPCPKILTKQF